MNEFIIIKKCQKKSLWYSNKVNRIFKVDTSLKFPGQYTVHLKNTTGVANHGMVDLSDAERIIPTFCEQIKIKLGFKVSRP